MQRTFLEAIRHRRSYYALGNQVQVSDAQIEQILADTLRAIPSAFNMQSARMVLLLGQHHHDLWTIVQETLRSRMPADRFPQTAEKIARSFAAGYGTVLFYEERAVVEQEQRNNPLYAVQFEAYSEQSTAMHQLAVWTLLEELGLGASLQHYNPLIDHAVAERWPIAPSWRLMAQMPFGAPLDQPAAREQRRPLSERLRSFGT